VIELKCEKQKCILRHRSESTEMWTQIGWVRHVCYCYLPSNIYYKHNICGAYERGHPIHSCCWCV